MPVKNWSDDILLVELSDDPIFTEEILAAFDRLEADPAQDVVLSLQAVNFINSSNLAKLLKLRRMILQSGRRLRLCTISSHAWGVFLATGLDKIFDFADDVSTALTSLQIDRQPSPEGQGGQTPASDE